MKNSLFQRFRLIIVMLGMIFFIPMSPLKAKTPVAYILYESAKRMCFDYVDDGVLNIIRRDAYLYWEGKDVSDSGHTNNADFYPEYPKWNKFPIIKEIQTVEFHEAFADVKPVCAKGWFAGFESLEKIIRLKYLNTSNVKTMSEMFSQCESLTSLDLTSFNTSNVTDMSAMFYGCKSLKTLNLASFNTAKVTDMSSMFSSCESLTSLNLSSFNTSKVTYMTWMFSDCESLEKVNLSSFNTSNVTDMDRMFAMCNRLKELNLSSFNTSNVTNMNQMFYECESLERLDLSSFNTSNVVNMFYMFNRCISLKKLNVSKFDTHRVKHMSGMFEECRSLKTLDVTSFRTDSVVYMGSMFSYCHSLTALDLRNFSTENVTDVSSMFLDCEKLRTILCRDTWNVGKSDLMFYNCFSLVGAIKYDDKKANCTYANPNSGYFSSYKTYPLTICGVTVNNLNCGDLTLIEGVGLRDPNGYVTYDPDEFTLNLNSAVITSTGKTAIKFQLGAITRFNINVEEGTSTVRTSSGTSGMAVIDLYNDTQIYGDGQLNIIGRSMRYGELYGGYEVPAIVAHKNLTLFGVSVTARGTFGICGSTTGVGDGKISIFGYDYDHRVVAEGTNGSICNFSSSYITEDVQQPAGAKFTDNAVRLNGEIVKSEVIIGAPVSFSGVFIAGEEVTSINSDDLSVINGVKIAEDGYLRFDWDTNTLKMNGATVESDGIALCNKRKNLKVSVEGDKGCGLYGGGEAAFLIEEPTTVTCPGGGVLYVGSEKNKTSKGILLRTQSGNLIVDDGNLFVLGTYAVSTDSYTYKNGGMMMVGYYGEMSVTGNSWIYAEGTNCDFGPVRNLTLGKNIWITEPFRATFKNNCVYYNNQLSKGIGVVIEYYNPCDVNEDGEVNISDVVAVINTMAGDETYESTSDVNFDTKTDISDVVAIINVMAGADPPPHPVPTDPATEAGFCPDIYHPHVIDMGDGGKWSCCNVGASSPWEYGGYYAWGEKAEKSIYNYSTYALYDWNMNMPMLLGDICATNYDVAFMNWQGNWRMPTYSHALKLTGNVKSYQKTTLNGINGIKVTANNGNSIFLPAGGYVDGTEKKNIGENCYLWTSTQGNQWADYTIVSNGSAVTVNVNVPCVGQNVRPISVQ
jgi:surface protein